MPHYTKLLSVLSVLIACLGFAGCKKEEPSTATTGQPSEAKPSEAKPSEPAALSQAAIDEASSIYQKRCVPCHGEAGEGDGPASAGLEPQPRKFSDASWQGSVTDEHLEKVIVFGGAAVGKSPAMPPNPDLGGKPEIVKALTAKVRSFKR